MNHLNPQTALEFRINDLLRAERKGLGFNIEAENNHILEMDLSECAKLGIKLDELEQSPFAVSQLEIEKIGRTYPIAGYLFSDEIINLLHKVGKENHWKSEEFFEFMKNYQYAIASDLFSTLSFFNGFGKGYLRGGTEALIINQVFETKEKMVKKYNELGVDYVFPVELIQKGLKGRILRNNEIHLNYKLLFWPEEGMSGMK